MSCTILSLLILLSIKHWYVDFVNQSGTEISHKGTYGNWIGFKHSLKHGFLTTIILLCFVNPKLAILCGLLDTFIHYHIDWIKSNYSNILDTEDKNFWTILGADQALHHMTYLWIAFIISR